MEINLKEQYQNIEIEKLINKDNVALQWATGTGKTFAAIKLAQKWEAKDILVLVAEKLHEKNWKEELNKHNVTIENITFKCYASMKNITSNRYDCIIFDEAHHLKSEKRMQSFSLLQTKKRIFLSATIQTVLLQIMEETGIRVVTSILNSNTAIDKNLLPIPKIILHKLSLSTTQTVAFKEEWGKKDKRLTVTCDIKTLNKMRYDKYKYPAVAATVIDVQTDCYNYLNSQFSLWKTKYMNSQQEYAKTKWLLYGSKRKRLLGEAKTEEARLLLNTINTRKVVFCTSIEQAEELGGNNCIHSKKNNVQEIVNDFNIGKINSLYAVGMATEGQNLTNINAGIIIQLDNEERTFIQKFGRVLRSDSPVQHILYFQDTRDEEFLCKVLEGIDTKYIEYAK